VFIYNKDDITKLIKGFKMFEAMIMWYLYGAVVALVLSVISVKLNYLLPVVTYKDYGMCMLFSWISVILLVIGIIAVWITKRKNRRYR
jgi:hypothetical protein